MTGSGGNIGGGACSRSMTVFAISAAERIGGASGAARGFEARRGAAFLRIRFEAIPGRAGLADWGFCGRTVFGARTGFAGDLRMAGLSFKVAAGRGGRSLPAASTLRRACLAAFLAALNVLRASLRFALARRTWALADAAVAPALAATVFSRLSKDGLGVIYGSTRNKNWRISTTSSAQTACAIGYSRHSIEYPWALR